ncbi:MAG TPA: sigma-70 family RNA polymerase sigma factor [Pirellulales bacterium]|nr:sigma-70 family RNA polymerase sigma factor [Pirellulales bacterium]
MEETVRRAQHGDSAAFADLITRFERTALAVAYAVLGDDDRAGESVQEAFVRAWQRLDELREPERFGAWLCGIVRHLAHDARRRAARECRARAAVPVVHYAGRTSDPAVRLEERETARRLTDALAELDELSRTAVMLRYYDGLSSKEIGRLLDLTPAAVDMRLMRARQALRRELAGDEPDESRVEDRMR